MAPLTGGVETGRYVTRPPTHPTHHSTLFPYKHNLPQSLPPLPLPLPPHPQPTGWTGTGTHLGAENAGGASSVGSSVDSPKAKEVEPEPAKKPAGSDVDAILAELSRLTDSPDGAPLDSSGNPPPPPAAAVAFEGDANGIFTNDTPHVPAAAWTVGLSGLQPSTAQSTAKLSNTLNNLTVPGNMSRTFPPPGQGAKKKQPTSLGLHDGKGADKPADDGELLPEDSDDENIEELTGTHGILNDTDDDDEGNDTGFFASASYNLPEASASAGRDAVSGDDRLIAREQLISLFPNTPGCEDEAAWKALRAVAGLCTLNDVGVAHPGALDISVLGEGDAGVAAKQALMGFVKQYAENVKEGDGVDPFNVEVPDAEVDSNVRAIVDQYQTCINELEEDSDDSPRSHSGASRIALQIASKKRLQLTAPTVRTYLTAFHVMLKIVRFRMISSERQIVLTTTSELAEVFHNCDVV